jgi:hypothetical protein
MHARMAVVSNAGSRAAIPRAAGLSLPARFRAALCVSVTPEPPRKPTEPVKPENDPEIPPETDPPPREPPQRDPPSEPPDVHDPEPHKINDPPAPGAPPEIIA